MKSWRRLLAGALLAASSTIASGHASSTAYLDIGAATANEVPFQWTVALRDLDSLLDLDADGDGRLVWSEVDARRAAITHVLEQSVHLTAAGTACALRAEPLRFAALESGGFVVLQALASCTAPPTALRLDYRFLARVDATHRALVTTPQQASPVPVAPGRSIVLPLDPVGGAAAPEGPEAPTGFIALLGAGLTHILGGPDHLLFLVALLLPSVLVRRHGRWIARTSLRPALAEVAGIVTAFTIAHSVTLGLASFHVVAVPARVIEPLIAVTVLAAALNNIRPLVTRRLAAVAFFFGLIHGFGFAEVLAPLSLPAPQLAKALLGFNLGVEAGQLAIVAAVFALLAGLRRWRGYPKWVLATGSALLSLTACVWIVERVFDVPLFAQALAGG